MLLPPGCRFYLMRHGQTDDNRRQVRCGGDVDVPLNATGRDQADALGGWLKSAGLGITWIMSSTLQRTDETARRVAAQLGLMSLDCDPRLNERRLGEWNGLPIAATEAWLRAGQTPPGGESAADFRTRIEVWLADTLPRFDQPGLIVASKGVGRVLSEILTGAAGLPMDNASLLHFEGSAAGNRVRRLDGPALR